MTPFFDTISKKEVDELETQAVFNGRIYLIDTIEKAEKVLPLLLTEKIVGFDCEAKPIFKKGEKPSKVALIQISTKTDAYLFHTKKLGFQ